MLINLPDQFKSQDGVCGLQLLSLLSILPLPLAPSFFYSNFVTQDLSFRTIYFNLFRSADVSIFCENLREKSIPLVSVFRSLTTILLCWKIRETEVPFLPMEVLGDRLLLSDDFPAIRQRFKLNFDSFQFSFFKLEILIRIIQRIDNTGE